jgi:hypothetical protein
MRYVVYSNHRQYITEKLSFSSKFFILSKDMAKEIIDAHNKWMDNKSALVNFSAYPHLAKVIDDMNAFFKASSWKGLFIRLSTRSPKDAALSRPSVSTRLKAEYERLCKEELEVYPKCTELSTLLHALYRITTFLLKSTDAKEAMQLIVESKRIQSDLVQYIAEGKDDDFNFILREFADFEPENEFRVFVYGKNVTAITQYNDGCFFPRLHANALTFSELIKEVINKTVIPVLPPSLSNSIIDIIVIQNKASEFGWDVKVVEVNPFAEFAGSGLFKWEVDWKVLMGREAFEFRYAMDPKERATLAEDWFKVVKDSGLDTSKFF